MHVQVNTDNRIPGSEALTRHVEGVVEEALGRFGDRITRVEVHLGDVNGPKRADDDNRCLMEARLAGLKPISATHAAATLRQVIAGAAKKLRRSLNSTLGKLNGRRRRTAMPRGTRRSE
jgi:hypothetical protein